jgi:hypothetical protein
VCLTWQTLSVSVRWRPPLAAVMVTHLVTRSSRQRQSWSLDLRSDGPVVIPCLQSTPRLSEAVSDVAADGSLVRSKTASVGIRCGQGWWSGSLDASRNGVKAILTHSFKAASYVVAATASAALLALPATPAARPGHQCMCKLPVKLPVRLPVRLPGMQRDSKIRSGRMRSHPHYMEILRESRPGGRPRHAAGIGSVLEAFRR